MDIPTHSIPLGSSAGRPAARFVGALWVMSLSAGLGLMPVSAVLAQPGMPPPPPGMGERPKVGDAPPKMGDAPDPKQIAEQVKALAMYPGSVRKAILELSQYPDLVTTLAAKKSPEERMAALAGQPAEAASAAGKVVPYDGIIEIMAKDIKITTLVGKVYGANKELIDSIGAEMEKKLTAQQSASGDAWSQRLSGDDKAAEQMLAIVKEKSDEASKSGKSSTDSAEGATSTGDTLNIAYTPSSDTAQQILDQSDTYAELAAELIKQWKDEYAQQEYGSGSGNSDSSNSGNDSGTGSNNSGSSDSSDGSGSSDSSGSGSSGSSGDYGQAVSDWWNTWGSYIPTDAVNGSALNDYVKEAGQAGRQLAQEAGGKQLTRQGLTDFLKKNSDRYPLLGKGAATAKPGTRAPSPFAAGEKHGAKMSAGGPKAGGHIVRQTPTQGQQVARAQVAHKAGWGGAPKGSSTRIKSPHGGGGHPSGHGGHGPGR